MSMTNAVGFEFEAVPEKDPFQRRDVRFIGLVSHEPLFPAFCRMPELDNSGLGFRNWVWKNFRKYLYIRS